MEEAIQTLIRHGFICERLGHICISLYCGHFAGATLDGVHAFQVILTVGSRFSKGGIIERSRRCHTASWDRDGPTTATIVGKYLVDHLWCQKQRHSEIYDGTMCCASSGQIGTDGIRPKITRPAMPGGSLCGEMCSRLKLLYLSVWRAIVQYGDLYDE